MAMTSMTLIEHFASAYGEWIMAPIEVIHCILRELMHYTGAHYRQHHDSGISPFGRRLYVADDKRWLLMIGLITWLVLYRARVWISSQQAANNTVAITQWMRQRRLNFERSYWNTEIQYGHILERDGINISHFIRHSLWGRNYHE